MTQNAESVLNDIRKWFADNIEVFNRCIEALDDKLGCLGNARLRNMCELDEELEGCEPLRVLEIMYSAYDDDVPSNGGLGQFCPARKYFYLDKNDNYVSTNVRDYMSDGFCTDENLVAFMRYLYDDEIRDCCEVTGSNDDEIFDLYDKLVETGEFGC